MNGTMIKCIIFSSFIFFIPGCSLESSAEEEYPWVTDAIGLDFSDDFSVDGLLSTDRPHAYYRFSGRSGAKYTIEAVSDVPGFDSFLSVYDSSANILCQNSDAWNITGSKAVFYAPADGVYYIDLCNEAGNGGEFRIRISEELPDQLSLPQDIKTWTVLIYMAADNDLNDYGKKTIDHLLADVGGSDGNINIVVLWDETISQNNIGTQDSGYRNGYYYIGSSRAVLLEDIGRVDTGEVDVALNFVDYTLDNFPAERYMMVFWGHGNGIARSVCYDYTTFGRLTEIEQREILMHFADRIEQNIDIVVYDACKMGMVEVFYALHDLVDYAVASEENISAYGLNFSFLRHLKAQPMMSSGDIVGEIVGYYGLTYLHGSEVSLRAVDIGKINELAIAINSFSEAALNSGLQPDDFPAMDPYRKMLFPFISVQNYFGDILEDPLLSFGDIETSAVEILEILDELTVQEFESTDSHFQSITLLGYTPTARYLEQDFSQDTLWDEYLLWIDP